MNPLYLFGREMTPLRKLLMMKAVAGGVPLTEYTATGNPLTFDTNIAKPLNQLLIPWTPTQSGSGDPSPENVRPISGVSGVTVYHSGEDTSDPTSYPVTFPALGKNLLEMKYGNKVPSISTGEMVSSNGWSSDYVRIDNSKNYCLSIQETLTSGNVYVFYYGSDYSYLGVVSHNTQTSFTLNNDSKFSSASFIKVRNDSSQSATINLQLEIGTTATTFEPYTNTVYGGSLDVTTGVLTAKWKYATLNNADIWMQTGTAPIYSHPFDDRKYGTTYGLYCTSFATSKMSSGIPYIRWTGANSSIIGVSINSSSITLSDIKIMASNNEISIAYELEIPLTWQLTPLQVTALIGTNTIWSDTNGSNTAKYLKKG